MTDLAARLDRVEATEAIRQLAAHYALAVDMRDLDALVALYVADIRTGDGTGRAALRAIFDQSLRQFTTSAHLVSNHVIEFLGPDDALGLVNCRIEHEVGGSWVTAVLLYHDRYQRRNGCWYFRGRVQQRLYATAETDPPVGPNKVRWPGAEATDGHYHDAFASWARFWRAEPGQAPAEAPANVDTELGEGGADRFISRLRGGTALPKPPRYIF